MHCTACGTSLPAAARFCDNCGAPQPNRSQQPATSALARPQPATVAPHAGTSTPAVAQPAAWSAQPALQAAAYPAPYPAPINVHTTYAPPPQPIIFQQQRRGPGLLVRGLWFIFLGYWLAGLALAFAYLTLLVSLGLLSPVAFAIFNRVPYLLTLRERSRTWVAQTQGGVTTLREATLDQRPWYLRALYFVFVGWWLTAIWISVAWTIGIFLITLPLTIWMLDRISGIATLQRH